MSLPRSFPFGAAPAVPRPTQPNKPTLVRTPPTSPDETVPLLHFVPFQPALPFREAAPEPTLAPQPPAWKPRLSGWLELLKTPTVLAILALDLLAILYLVATWRRS
jgi:hypothetical protein